MDGADKLLTAAGDQSTVLWDVPTSKKINSFHGHTSSVRSVNFKTNDSGTFKECNNKTRHNRILTRDLSSTLHTLLIYCFYFLYPILSVKFQELFIHIPKIVYSFYIFK